MNDTILLGVQTMFGDSDVVQTHIQFWGIFITIISISVLIISINLQRLALEEQTEVNRIQNLVNVKELIPKVSIESTPTIDGNFRKTIVLSLIIEHAEAIIHNFGWKENHSSIIDEENLFVSYNIPIFNNQDLLKFKFNVTNLRQYEFKYNINDIPKNKRNEYILELFYSDKYNIGRYKSEFYIDLLQKNSPVHLIAFYNIK